MHSVYLYRFDGLSPKKIMNIINLQCLSIVFSIRKIEFSLSKPSFPVQNT